MPYATNDDLPPGVRHALPPHALDIFRAAFNGAWRQHAERGDLTEAMAFRIAWAAVKKKYEKVAGAWVLRSDN
jgi:cation transport regulator